MGPLTSKEIRAIRKMPEFKASLRAIEEKDREDDERRKAERALKHAECPGDPSASVDLEGRVCGKCGLHLKYSEFASLITLNRLIEGKHWKHANGGNPAREDGLYGKSAAAADGDWYSSH